MDNENGDPAELVAAFHLMYDRFPGACTLVHKTKRVAAVNPACKDIGREVGMICSKHGPPEAHKGCLANQAVAEHAAKRVQTTSYGAERVIYWLPVDGYDDYYIHFSAAFEPPAEQA
ncbi:MAG: hypothetical protein LUC93_18695 [Planctomycetaceae bacterium]|nr:hypothetical protein [Planctomycetaceae bacterium]